MRVAWQILLTRVPPAFVMALLMVLLPASRGELRAQGEPSEPILDTYSLQLGETDAAGVTAHVVDSFFGHGTARARLLYVGPSELASGGTGTLSLRVWRKLRGGQIAFALLVFRVEVRGFGADGTLVHSQDLPDFSFGDSASGNWSRTLDGIPASAVKLEVTFVGNYE